LRALSALVGRPHRPILNYRDREGTGNTLELKSSGEPREPAGLTSNKKRQCEVLGIEKTKIKKKILTEPRGKGKRVGLAYS